MKTLHFSIIIISGIIPFVVLGVYLIMNPINDVLPKILITNITTTPETLHVGDHFTVNAIVNNVGSRTVYFDSNYI
ncbi:MAG: hypothetical protein KGI27_14515 [Thaumarchaeota archaeon]|nr:hypothetical protein [Nitrososphaerota archaeon]